MMSCIFDDNLLVGIFVLPLLDATMTHCVTGSGKRKWLFF